MGAVRRALAELSRQALHAGRLSLRHPLTGRQLVFESDVPEDMRRGALALGVPAPVWATVWKEDP
jgi:23S rRNA pseudouridine1911/1915/1917 synthase